MRTQNRYLRHVGVMIAAGALVLGGVTATTAAASAPARSAPTASATKTVDDATTHGSDRFSYSRGWTNCKRCDRAALKRSFHYTSTPRASVTLTFTGHRATLFGFTQRSGGTVAVSIDGRSVGVVNTATTGRRTYAALYTTPRLREGRHSVTFTVLKRTTGSGRVVAVDKAVVTRDVQHPRPHPTTTTAPSTHPTQTTRPVPPTTHPATTTTTSTTRTPPPGPVPGGGVASITLDDGKMNQYQNARPALDAAGVKATFFIISDALTWGSSSMTATEVRGLAAAGHEIGDHSKTHANLTTLSADGVEAELGGSATAIRNATGITPTTCAYPYGQSNDTVRTVAAKHFSACRGTSGGVNTTSSLARYDLRTYYVTTSTTAAQVRDAAASARASNAWIIFVYHGVGTVSSTDDVTTQSFTDQLAAIRGTGIPIRTVSQALS